MAAAVPVPPDGWQADTPLPSPSPAAAPLTPPAGALRGLLAPGLDTTHVAAATPPPMTATGSSPDDCLARCECDALLGAHPRPRANDTEAGPLDTPLPSSSLLSPVRAAAAVLFTILWAGALLALACLALWLAARYAMPPVPEPDRSSLKWPASRADLVSLHHTLLHYAITWPHHVFMAHLALFCFSQIFVLPGIMPLSIASGLLWGPLEGTLICLSATIPGILVAYEVDVMLRASLFGVGAVERSIQARRKVLRSPRPLRHLIHLRLAFRPWGWMLTFVCASAGTPLPKLIFASVLGRAPYAAGYTLLGASASAAVLKQDPSGWLLGAVCSFSIPLLASSWVQRAPSLALLRDEAPRDYGTMPPVPVPSADRRSSRSAISVQNPPSPTPWTADTPATTLTGLSGLLGAGPIVALPEEDTSAAWGPGPTGSSRIMRPVRAPSLREPTWDLPPGGSLVAPVHGHPPKHNPFTSSDHEELDERTTPQEELDQRVALEWEAARLPHQMT